MHEGSQVSQEEVGRGSLGPGSESYLDAEWEEPRRETHKVRKLLHRCLPSFLRTAGLAFLHPSFLPSRRAISGSFQRSASSFSLCLMCSHREERNVLEAAGNGAAISVGLVANIAVNLIAFLAVLEFINATLAWLGSLVNLPDLSFQVPLTERLPFMTSRPGALKDPKRQLMVSSES